MKTGCGCCRGVAVLTPAKNWNRPGLGALGYRVATHGTFLETMKARLSSLYLDIPTDQFDEENRPITSRIYPLKALKRRDDSDPAIALLDAWATVGDVLTFYQERIANEGYLRTATERRSILELARLVGYRLRPGVSASVYLAYTLEDKSEPVVIPAGTRSQSVPGPDESPQFFETSEALPARAEWNDLKPRMSRPQRITLEQDVAQAFKGNFNPENVFAIRHVYVEGTATNLNRGDALLFVFGKTNVVQAMRRVEKVNADFEAGRTEVVLQAVSAQRITVAYLVRQVVQVLAIALQKDAFDENTRFFAERLKTDFAEIEQTLMLGGGVSLSELEQKALNATDTSDAKLEAIMKGLAEAIALVQKKPPTIPQSASPLTTFDALAKKLFTPQSLTPANRALQSKNIVQVFSPALDANPHLYSTFHRAQAGELYTAWANASINPADSDLQEVHALRVTAALFGYNAPLRMVMKPNTDDSTKSTIPFIAEPGRDWDPVESETSFYLDNLYKEILPESFIVLQTQSGLNRVTPTQLAAFKIQAVNPVSRTDYGISSKTTRLDLYERWWGTPTAGGKGLTMADLRRALVYAQSEALALAEEPINDDVAGNRIETGRLYDGLDAGRWLVVTGERTDIAGTAGVRAAELVMLTAVEQAYDPTRRGEKTHSTLVIENRSPDQNGNIQNKLAYTYKRGTVKIYGNVVKATNGETRGEVLGSGDATRAFQQFVLKQPPLTYVAAATVDGVASTLQVRVNDIEWHETDSLVWLAPADRNFVTVTDDDAKTSVGFGDGEHGARPPTGLENITAVYRSGIGKGGNVKAEQITLPITKPLGVKEVINPLRASGGADKESRDLARRNAPLAVMALDRLVSTVDYADFARTFAGIAKASAMRLSDGQRQIVHLTIAGVDDIPIDVNSDLYQSLRRALHQFGDPYQAVRIDVRELLALVLSASVHILPDYLEEKVEPAIRQALLDTFSFDKRELGQAAFLSEAIRTIQQVEGVSYVDIDVFDATSEEQVLAVIAGKDQAAPGATGNAATTVPALALDPTPHAYVNARMARVESGVIKPAELAFFLPDAPETLILNLIKEASV